jgi:pimeloyl-ACP methyl ester carboxylesterase
MPIVKINDISMHYELYGEGEPVVLIAGLGTDISPYKEIIRRLSQKYKVMAFDNRGVGQSDKPDMPYTIGTMAKDTAGLMEAAIPAKQANVIGISMGGRIAVELALERPELVKKLVLVSTSPCVKKNAISPLAKLIKWVRGSGRMFGRSSQPYYAFIRQLNASRSYDCTQELARLKMPTLILHGRKDMLTPYAQALDMHSRIKGSNIIAFKGGHLFFFWDVKHFVDTICGFFGSPSLASTAEPNTVNRL